MQAIVMRAYGGPEVLQIGDWQRVEPKAGEVTVEVRAAGINFMDHGSRMNGNGGLFELPSTPGIEGAGVVSELGPDVTEFAVGDRVAWFFAPGSYSEKVVAPVTSLVPVPDAVSDTIAGGLLMQALTANHFTTETYRIEPGSVALVHSAAGGVGLMLTQMIKMRGGTVIGTVSDPAKVDIARAAGADDVIVSTGGGFVDEVLRITGGEGVNVVYDGAGAATFQGSLAVLARHGVLAYFGPVLNPAPPLDLLAIPRSAFVTYPVVQDHVHSPELLRRHGTEMFDLVEKGELSLNIGRQYALADAAQAHTDMLSRSTTGKLLLIP
jgi:NADPH2:quinone reductase